MRIIAAYMLAVLGGKQNPSAADLKAILDSVSIHYDEAEMKHVIDQLHGKDLDALIAEGRSKLAAVPSGGGGGGGAAAAPAAAGGAAASKKDEAKPKEKEKEKEEEEEVDLGFSLFD